MPTILHRLSKWASENPKDIAQTYKSSGSWVGITTREFMSRVFHLALYFEANGFNTQSIACIYATNSPEWVHCDLAAQLLGGQSAGIYPNSTPKDIHYVVAHTEASILIVQNKEFFNKILAGGELPSSILKIVVFDGDTSIAPFAVSYEEAISEGAKLAKKFRKKAESYLKAIDPQAPAFLVYTSGTTGNPKGAILSHDNLVFTADVISQSWDLPYENGSLFSFLPLCHIAERLQNIGVGISQRYTVNFATKFENLTSELVEVQPTLLLSVPRLWEKMMEGVLNRVKNSPMPRRRLIQWALEVGARVAEAKYSGKFPSLFDLAQREVADRLVLSKIRQAMGLGNAEKIASGAAALPSHVSRWFRSIGLEILECFGQTESTGVICVTEPGLECAGTVGKPIDGIEFKIAEDGEVLCLGRNVFKGYFKDPVATAQTLPPSEGGWLYTGDLAEFTSQGLIKVRGRKKEVLKTSGGKMIAPLPIEETLKASELISQVCIVGDGRNYLSALITLSEDVLTGLKDRPGVLDDLVIRDPEINKVVRAKVDEVNRALSSYEKIKNFAILSREFSIAEGEMTPTLKMKRNVIENRFCSIIDKMYNQPSR